MDPNATYNDWVCAVLAEDKAAANNAYNALRVWLERGGFEPNWGVNGRKQFFTYNTRTGMLDLVDPIC